MIRLVIVDDSTLVRKALISALRSAPDISVVGEAEDAFAARERILELDPDVITLDIRMPRMDGLTFLEKLMEHHPIPVVMFSSVTTEGSQEAIRALEMGATDVVCKPTSSEDTKRTYRTLVNAVRAAAASKSRGKRRSGPTSALPLMTSARTELARHRVLAIGASTGGTIAIRELLDQLPADVPGTVIVQHMPESFTDAFAQRLSSVCPMEVREARNGDRVQPGLALVAPGNKHMVLVKQGAGYVVETRGGPLVHHQRPAVDVLFHSVARYVREDAVGVVLTGMGADGASGLLEMREAGARTFAQDEESSVVYGMPKEAALNGGAEKIVALQDMGEAVMRALCAKRRTGSSSRKRA